MDTNQDTNQDTIKGELNLLRDRTQKTKSYGEFLQNSIYCLAFEIFEFDKIVKELQEDTKKFGEQLEYFENNYITPLLTDNNRLTKIIDNQIALTDGYGDLDGKLENITINLQLYKGVLADWLDDRINYKEFNNRIFKGVKKWQINKK